MKIRRLYQLCFLLIALPSFSDIAQAQKSASEEIAALVEFFDEISGNSTDYNWELAEFEESPTQLSENEVRNFLVSKGIIRINNSNLTTAFSLDKAYGGALTVENFSALTRIYIKDCVISTLQCESNNSLITVTITSCTKLKSITFSSGHNKFKELKISDCAILQKLDLYGSSDPYDPLNSSQKKQTFRILDISKCPLLETFDCRGCSKFSDYDFTIDNPGTLTALYTSGSSLTSLSYFINLQLLDCSYTSVKSLSISALTRLHTFKCDHNSISEIELPPDKQFTYGTDNVSISFNALSNRAIQELFGDLRSEMLHDKNIYPQKIKEVNNYMDRAELIVIGYELDLSNEKFEAPGFTSEYSWYRLNSEQKRILVQTNIESKSYEEVLNEWESGGEKVKLDHSGSSFTPEEELKGDFLFCLIKPVSTTRQVLADDPDPNTYHLFQIIAIPKVEFEVRIEGGEWGKVLSGNKTTVDEGQSVDIRAFLNRDGEGGGSFYYRYWTLLFKFNGKEFRSYSMNAPGGEVYFYFTEVKPYTEKGVYTLESLWIFLATGDSDVGPFPAPYKHTIEIKGKDPGPDPPHPPDPPDPAEEPDPFPGIKLTEEVTVCNNKTDIELPYKLLYEKDETTYRITFSEEALQVGFSDMDKPVLLPENGIITIPLPPHTPGGSYRGTVHLYGDNIPGLIEEYNFKIYTLRAPHLIFQPSPVAHLCVNDPFILEVEAEGDELTYQWYHQDKPIKGEIYPRYEALYAEDKAGDYFVQITGACGVIYSDTVAVSGSRLYIDIKWDDLLYILNPDKKYVRYQWFRNGQSIDTYGNAQYYTDPAGLSGSYMVRAFYADGLFDESCLYIVNKNPKSPQLYIYPTPVTRNHYLTVEISDETDHKQNSRIELINMSGKKVYSKRMVDKQAEILVTFPAGLYILTITSPTGEIEVRKLIVKE